MGKSKRASVAKLPKDWREKVVAAALHSNAGDAFKAAVAVLCVTGCRPEELEAGVACLKRQNGQLELRIRGAKTGTIDNGKVVADRGQPWRALIIDADASEASRYLAALCSNKPSALVQFNKDSLRKMVGRVAKRVYPKKDGAGISPYCFRHAMAADLKSCDELTDEQRAMALGHLSVESIASYGRRRRGGGGGRRWPGCVLRSSPEGECLTPPVAPARGLGMRLG